MSRKRIEGIKSEKTSVSPIFRWTFIEHFSLGGPNCIFLVPKIFFGESFFEKKFRWNGFKSWANAFRISCDIFRQCCQNCILRLEEKIYKNIFFENIFRFILLLDYEQRHFGKLMNNLAKLGKTALYVSKKTYWRKTHWGEKFHFPNNFRTFVENFSLGASKLQSTCTEDLLQGSFYRKK